MPFAEFVMRSFSSFQQDIASEKLSMLVVAVAAAILVIVAAVFVYT
jgi:hypothetical protein